MSMLLGAWVLTVEEKSYKYGMGQSREESHEDERELGSIGVNLRFGKICICVSVHAYVPMHICMHIYLYMCVYTHVFSMSVHWKVQEECSSSSEHI